MISYNVSVTIDAEIETTWVHWMKTSHIPDVMNTGCFVKYDFYKLIKPEGEEGITFIIQYKALHMDDYESYKEKYSAELQKQTIDRFRDQFVAFRTLMVEVM
ncbi:MAG: DUF4286 family protein [Saprospiraceae bacterium]|jgi:hypothetical protein|nr:DUF4286 family protein [Saprospiraceae bacterium]MCO5277444.1 DUF4286 family protein [Saprospiraceae bacterium]